MDRSGLASATAAASRGSLDGVTILRYAHAFESGGGVEQHLADLNRTLGLRNRLTTIQLQLTHDASLLEETRELIGDSVLIKSRVFVPGDGPQAPPSNALAGRLTAAKQFALDGLLPSARSNRLVAGRLMAWRKVPRRPGEPEGVGQRAAELLRRYPVELVVLHAGGGADASAVIDAAARAAVPVLMVHHFSNDRLGNMSLRQQVSRVAGVAGASRIGVPRYLEASLRNLSDAVDTDFFRRDRTRTHSQQHSGPVLYAPARVVPEKGQADVLEVASLLLQRGMRPKVVFAGREDSPQFMSELVRLTAQKGLSDAVEFLGPLSMDQYRDRYVFADVMLLPTRHHEGMPRTVIDAQAMEVPPVVYDAGGIREGLIDRATGFVVRQGDVAAMADAVESMVRDPALRQRIAAAGRKFVEDNFSLSAFARRHEDIYLALIRNHDKLPQTRQDEETR